MDVIVIARLTIGLQLRIVRNVIPFAKVILRRCAEENQKVQFFSRQDLVVRTLTRKRAERFLGKDGTLTSEGLGHLPAILHLQVK